MISPHYQSLNLTMGLILSKLFRVFNYQNSFKDTKIKVVEIDPSNSHCATKEVELKDWISELPDDILFSFFSDLPLKEVGRLSILSSRWRNPWKHSKRLNFENDLVNERKVFLDEFDKINFVNWVNQVLESHDTTTLELVRFSYGLDKSYKSDLDNWLRIVFSKQVENIDLNLRLRDRIIYMRNRYTLTHSIFSTSSAEGRGLVHERFIGFKSLKSLHLSDVILSDELVDFLLDNCSALELLSIDFCSLKNFRVTGKKRALRYLKLGGYFENIEVSDVNLVSFACDNGHKEPKLILKNIPSLINLHLGGSMAKSYLNSRINDEIAQFSGSLKSLTLSLPHELGRIAIRTLPELSALKELVVQKSGYHDIYFTYYRLIEMCPNLQKFEYQATWVESTPIAGTNIDRSRYDPLHHCLKEVKLSGYYGCDLDVTSAFYFFDNAIALEKVIIDPHDQDHVFHGTLDKVCETKRELAARERAKKQLKKKAPKRVQLVIL